MPYLEWKEELETGISVIDGQHKRIVTYINQLHDVSQDTQTTEIEEIFNALIDYTISHFAFEESLIQDAEYPNSAQHIKKHDTFRNQIFAFQSRAAAGEKIANELLELLKAWLFEHILHEDGDYVDSLRAYMLKQDEGSQSASIIQRVGRFFK